MKPLFPLNYVQSLKHSKWFRLALPSLSLSCILPDKESEHKLLTVVWLSKQ